MEGNQSKSNSPRIPESSTSECIFLRQPSALVSSPRSFVNLPSMPIEIKGMIVDWIYCSGQTGDDLIHLRSLASVDRTFYQLCSAYLYKGIVLLGDTVERLTTLQPTVQRHSHHVRWLYWRASYEELCEEYLVVGNSDTWDENTRSQWDPKTRSELLLKILEACPRLNELDIDLDPFEYITDDSSPDKAASMWCYDDNMMNKFIKPISRLSSLVELTLTSPCDRPCFNETLLAKVIENLSQLRSFQCSGISASAPKTLTKQRPCQSPLGLKLASLPHLTKLTLESAHCFDISWTWLNWKGSLEELHLFHCDQVSIAVLHSFTKLFKSTLSTVRLHHVPAPHDASLNNDRISQDVLTGKLTFELSQLKSLSVSNHLPVGFLTAFQASKSLSEISLCEYPELSQSDVTAWLQDRVWPNLTEFNVCHTNGFESIQSLAQLAAKHGVKMCLNGNISELDNLSEVDSREEDLSEGDVEDTAKGDPESPNEIENKSPNEDKVENSDAIKDENRDDGPPEQIQDVMRMWTHGSHYEEEVEISDPREWNQTHFHLSDSILLKSNAI